MKYFYTKGWFRAHKKALAIYAEDEARKLHEEKKLYTVLVGDLTNPTAFIELNLKLHYVGVFFLDPLLNVKMEYIFGQSKFTQHLFLNRVVNHIFLPLENRLRKSKVTYFNEENGEMTIQTTDFDQNKILESKSENPVNLEDNYEPIPEFGNYESILRLDR